MAEGRVQSHKNKTRNNKDKDDKSPSCTVQDLRDILTFTTGGQVVLPTNDVDEVVEGIYIGNGKVAKSKDRLQKLGITHVLNAAKGPRDCYHVHTSQVMYRPWGIEFLGVEANDMPSFKINQHFQKSADFIEQCLAKGGRVLVHCVEGRSRSAALVLAYLISRCHMDARSAVLEVRRSREIYPNEGFLQQICNLNDQMIKRGVTLT